MKQRIMLLLVVAAIMAVALGLSAFPAVAQTLVPGGDPVSGLLDLVLSLLGSTAGSAVPL